MSTLTPNRILHGDCVDVMRELPAENVDFILTEPPYLVRWLKPAFAQMFQVLKLGSLALSFYGWNRVGFFFEAWKAAGFSVVGHLVFRKRYASSKRFFAYHHESAYLLARATRSRPPLGCRTCWTGSTRATGCTRRRSRWSA